MFEGMRFHHIGIAVFSLEETASMYEKGGYMRSGFVFDPEQNVDICWLTKDNAPLLELLAPVNTLSPVNSILEKNGVSPYHCCYEVDDIEQAIIELRKQRFIVVKKPVKAVALNNSLVAFVFHKNVGLVELVETPAINSQ